MKQLILVSGTALTGSEQRLLNFATWMGVSVKAATAKTQAEHEALQIKSGQDTNVFAMSADTLAELHKAASQSPALETFLNKSSAELLIFNCSNSAQHSGVLKGFTNGAIRDVTWTPDKETIFSFPDKAKTFSRQFASLTFTVGRKVSVPAFELSDTGAATEIITADDHPALLYVKKPSCNVFLLAGTDILDINGPVHNDEDVEQQYARLIPLLIFLRHAFNKGCWHGPPSTARLIIDDPLLTKKYGALDFNVLRDSMARKNFGTSIAFIPWNYRRTSRRTATKLLENSNLSICVHGCDHTNKEFQTTDTTTLGAKANLALQRLQAQQKRTGVDFEPVMVFPQGKFSTAAIAALRDNNYLAAVNSSCFPTSGEVSGLTLADFLRPAITRFHGFPLFQRRYPKKLVGFALDLFLGRPALVVEHHEYFLDGGAKFEEFLGGLQKLEPNLTWPTLTSQLMESCIMRSIGDAQIEVEFYTAKFKLKNYADGAAKFWLKKYEPLASAVKSVFINGANVPFSFERDYLKLETQLNKDQAAMIEIAYQAQPLKSRPNFGLAHNLNVMARRGLSEFRDNVLVRHLELLKFAKGVAKKLKITGQS